MRTALIRVILAATLALFCKHSAAGEDLCSDNIVIVLDASGSMNEPFVGGRSKMAAAKLALKRVLAKVPTTTRIGLLVFSGSNVPNEWLYPLQPRVDAMLNEAIDLPQPARGTPLGKYIKIGADKLLEQRAKQLNYGTYRLLIVTDGIADDQALVEKYTPEVMARGIRVEVIGVLMREEHILARRVHAYRRADDSAALSRALSDAVAEISAGPADRIAQEDFALIAPLSRDSVWPMLQSLTTPCNQPIGRAMPAPAKNPVQFTSAPVQLAKQPAPPAPHLIPTSSGGPMLMGIFMFVFLAAISWMIAITIRRKA